MNDFTASNGMQIRTHPSIDEAFGIFDANGNSTLNNSYDHLNDMEMQALREFFQAEGDERLGRWRWPYDGNRNVVVYPAPGNANRVIVLDERFATAVFRDRGDVDERFKTAETEAARAYFGAHPEPKPWHNAKVGEVWALKFGDRVDEQEYLTQCAGSFFRRISQDEDAFFDTAGTRAPEIIAGRRIWPEVSS